MLVVLLRALVVGVMVFVLTLGLAVVLSGQGTIGTIYSTLASVLLLAAFVLGPLVFVILVIRGVLQRRRRHRAGRAGRGAAGASARPAARARR